VFVSGARGYNFLRSVPILLKGADSVFGSWDSSGRNAAGGQSDSTLVISVPVGASFKVDGQDAGVTPKVVDFTIGSHTLEFSKEGYAPGTTPLEVGADELPGGSVSFKLGGLSLSRRMICE
jgi:PEGA domain